MSGNKHTNKICLHPIDNLIKQNYYPGLFWKPVSKAAERKSKQPDTVSDLQRFFHLLNYQNTFQHQMKLLVLLLDLNITSRSFCRHRFVLRKIFVAIRETSDLNLSLVFNF